MENSLTIAALRAELAMSQDDFAEQLGLASKGNVSVIERGGPVSLAVALRLEKLSGHRIDAAALNAEVAAAREAIHRGAAHNWALNENDFTDTRVVICAICERRTDDPATRGCTATDCPHVTRVGNLAGDNLGLERLASRAANIDADPVPAAA